MTAGSICGSESVIDRYYSELIPPLVSSTPRSTQYGHPFITEGGAPSNLLSLLSAKEAADGGVSE